MAKVTIPTQNEIEQLPRWAKVAFAARCARRVLPLFSKHWPNAPKEHVDAVTHAVEIAERYAAASTTTSATAAEAAEAAAQAAEAAAKAAEAATYSANANAAAANAVYAAKAAANAAAYIGSAYAANAVYAAKASVDYAANVVTVANPNVSTVSHIRYDFDFILNKSHLEKWTDNTPVPPSVFGPLDDPIAVIKMTDPIVNDEHVVMALQAFGEPGVSATTLAEQMLAVYKALNVYTLAKYGKHLSRGEFRRLVLQNAGVPA